MPYRSDETVDLAQQAREAAKNKNDLEWYTQKTKVARFVPELMKMALEEVKYASQYGEYWVDFKPPFWNIRQRFHWNKALRALLREELERKNFECMELLYSVPVLRISWSKDDVPAPRIGTEIAIPG